MNPVNHARRLFVVLLVMMLDSLAPVTADSLDRAILDSVSDATYEVVIPKPAKESITYERPLPLDQIPYAIRNDAYYSIGTAFDIGQNRLVSAAHVMGLGVDSQLKPLRVRDRQGKLYDIDQIIKYSLSRDFVVFTIKGKHSSPGLRTSPITQYNEKVYAVGNAYGQGIVFRDGLYTSDTPEEQDGKWKWMRFSAAASPGNSGGPLLDSKGRVIGVVLRKSENENLNYALPISEVLNAPAVADLDAKILYRLDNMDMSYTDRLHKDYPLPKTYAELDNELTSERHRFNGFLLDKLLALYSADIFPNGAGSTRLLNTTYDTVLPGIISKGEDGVWDMYLPSKAKTQTSDLGKNGSITFGPVNRTLLLHLEKPDNVSLKEIYKDSRLQMDNILRGTAIYRSVGAEKVKITSLGKALRDEVYTDHYARHWLLRTWNVPYNDQVLLLFSLPVPDGFVGIAELMPTAQLAERLIDIKALTDFVYVSYSGTLEQWHEFLQVRQLLPAIFNTIAIDFDYNKSFRYTSKRLTFAYGPEQMRITPRSDLKLAFSYSREKDKVVWDVGNVVTGEDKNSSTFFTVIRKLHPPRTLDDSYRHAWEDITQRRHPYNKSAYFDNTRTLIGDVSIGDLKPGQLSSAPLLYTTFFGADGNVGQKAAETRLKGFEEHLTIKEY